jgi:ABC-type antimicrobial peptide transport system permease subunit
MSEHVDRFLVLPNLMSRISGFFSLLALLLACIGVYGVMTYTVIRRTNEIGIRMALGAKAGGVLWMVLKESLLLLSIGVAIGLPATVGAARLIENLLFGVTPTDPATMVTAVVFVSGVAVLSGYLPARRAARVDPMVALRYE